MVEKKKRFFKYILIWEMDTISDRKMTMGYWDNAIFNFYYTANKVSP